MLKRASMQLSRLYRWASTQLFQLVNKAKPLAWMANNWLTVILFLKSQQIIQYHCIWLQAKLQWPHFLSYCWLYARQNFSYILFIFCGFRWLQGSILLLSLYLKWSINTKQADLIDRADWKKRERVRQGSCIKKKRWKEKACAGLGKEM